MNANICVSHNSTGRSISISNVPWDLLEQLKHKEARLELFEFKFYRFKTYDHVKIFNYDFIITKMSKNNTSIVSTFQNEDDEDDEIEDE